VDEVGYLSYDARYADLLFEVVTRRYEAQRPILLSTNKASAGCGDHQQGTVCTAGGGPAVEGPPFRRCQ
jgi:DNA replication protein DnaC